MGATADWKALAVSLFGSFGDVVLDADVTTYNGTPTYDESSGRMVKPSSTTASKMVFAQLTKYKYEKVFQTQLNVESHKVAYVLPVSGRSLSNGDQLKITSAGSAFSNKVYEIVELRTDYAGLEAYFIVLMKPVAAVG